MPETTFSIDIAFTADWHIGIGSGRHGAVDRTIATDSDGLPYVPAKSAIGVLRDSAEVVADALDQQTDGVWARWVDAVFGSQPSLHGHVAMRPRAAALTAEPLRMPEAQRNFIRAAPNDPNQNGLTRADLVSAARVIRTGVMIDDTTGTAVQDAFRVEERARAGITTTATWRIDHPTADIWPAKFLLLAAAQITRRVGGKRRRGAGTAQITLHDLGQIEDYAARLGAAPSPWEVERDGGAEPDPSSAPRGRLRHALDLIVEVVNPVVVDKGLWGNVIRTSRSIPGTMLLPLLRQALSVELADLVRFGDIVVTDATPEIAGLRGLPWPRALTQSKDAPPGDGTYVNVTVSHQENTRLKPRSDTFVDPDCTHWRSVAVTQGIHAVIDDVAQRPTSDSGGLFLYEGIAPGTVLRAEVWLPPGVEVDTESISGSRRIGRSSKDDYGLVHVGTVPPPPSVTSSSIPKGTPFSVWLTSDALLRNARGGTETTPGGFVAALRAVLGTGGELSLVPASCDSATTPPMVTATTVTSINRRQTWQRSWGLPRPSLTGLAAGSVFICSATEDIPAEAIARVESLGFGDRTAEGFGRVRVDVAALRSPEVTVSMDRDDGDAEGTSDTPTEANAHIVAAAWRTAASRRAAIRAEPLRSAYLHAKVSRAQLGNLRNVVNGLSKPDGHRAAGRWIGRTKAGKAKLKWGADELDQLRALLATDPGDRNHPVWERLGLGAPPEIPDDHRRLLTTTAVQVFLTEMIRVAGREAVN